MHAKGFSLIEILVVLIILSITISFALLAFGDFGASRRAVILAEQFVNYTKLLEQQAIMEATTLGITITDNSIKTFRLQPGKAWEPMPEKGLFRTQYFSENILVRLQTWEKNKINPGIMISQSGDLTPFSVTFGTTQKPNLVTVIGKQNGELNLNYPQDS
jgi:general secretion pathway protein H